MREIDQYLLARELAIARGAIPSCHWSQIADRIVAERQKIEGHLRKPDVNRALFGCLDDLKTKAVTVLPARLDPAKVAAIRDFLMPLAVYQGSHVYSSDLRLHRLEDVRKEATLAAYPADQLLRAPHLVDFLNEPAIIDFIEAAMGCVPTLYSVNAWWSFPSKVATGPNVQHFHRDTDGWRFFTLFIYLTDVDEDGGPHQIIAGSHTLEGMTRLAEGKVDPLATFSGDVYFSPEFSNFVEQHLSGAAVNVTGPAGTVFVANTIAAHRGLVPNKTPRLIVWARYGLGRNTNSMDLEQGPLDRLQIPAQLPDTPRNRYVNRLLFDYDRSFGPRAQ